MARPEIYNTLLGERLAFVRKELGYADRKSFAVVMGIKPDTLGTYERGVNEPDIALLTKYHELFSVNITWLITGEGFAFTNPFRGPLLGPAHLNADGKARASQVPDRDIDPPVPGAMPSIDIDSATLAIGRRINSAVKQIYAESTVKANKEDIDAAAVALGMELHAQVRDINDPKEVNMAFEKLMYSLQRDLDKMVAEPGSGKRSA